MKTETHPTYEAIVFRDLASGDGTWNRDQLVSIVGHRLTDADRTSLAETKDMRTLTRHLLDVGVLAPATILGSFGHNFHARTNRNALVALAA